MAKASPATTNQRAAPSTPPARPADSQPAPAPGATPDTTGEPDYELPTAAEISAHLNQEPASSAATDTDESTASDTDAEAAPPAPAPADEQPPPEAAPEAEADDEEPEPAPAADDAPPAPEAESATSEPEGDEGTPAAGDQEAPTTEEPATRRPHNAATRIDQLTARNKELETQLARLGEQLASANYTPEGYGKLTAIDDLAALKRAEHSEIEWHKWALQNEANPDGADLGDGKGGTVHYEPDQIRRIKAETFETLYRHLPARKAYLEERAGHESSAARLYPWLRETQTGFGADVQALIEARPYLRAAADYRLLAADAVVGAKLRGAGVRLDDKALATLARRLAKAPPPPAAAPRPTAVPQAAPPVRRASPSPARPGSLPARLTRTEAVARNASKAMAQGKGDLDSVANSIAAKMRF